MKIDVRTYCSPADVYANHSPYYSIPYWLLTPEIVAYLAGAEMRVPVMMDRQTTRGSGDVITYSYGQTQVIVRYSPITHDRGWHTADGAEEILGSEIVGYIKRGLALEAPIDLADEVAQ